MNLGRRNRCILLIIIILIIILLQVLQRVSSAIRIKIKIRIRTTGSKGSWAQRGSAADVAASHEPATAQPSSLDPYHRIISHPSRPG